MFNKEELDRLYRYSISLCLNEQDAYDLLHSSLEKVLKKSDKIEIQYPIRYMMRTIKNTHLNNIRNKKEESNELIETLEDKESVLEDLIINEMDAKTILSNCNDFEREVLYLWAYEGMSYQEIANSFEMSKGSLLTKIHNLKKKLVLKFG